MIPWVHLDSANMPGGGELRLMQRGAEFSIVLDKIELMNSRLSGSEEALATLTLEKIKGQPSPHVLIGGLGMGFTLRAALAALNENATITVAELVPSVVAWARGPMAEVFGTCLEDERVHISEGDVGPLMRANKTTYDAILLDVDNGPEGLTRKENDDIYSDAGLRVASAALRSGGALAVWSSRPDAQFTNRLKRTGLAVEEIKVRANAKSKGSRHVIWLATKASA